MSKVQRSAQACDRSALHSLEVGVVVVLLTGCVHYFIMRSPHFDFMLPDAEFFLVTAVVLLILALCLVDFRNAYYALRHLNSPHAKYAKPEAIAGIVLGVAILPPALIILAILIETQVLRFIQIKNVFEF